MSDDPPGSPLPPPPPPPPPFPPWQSGSGQPPGMPVGYPGYAAPQRRSHTGLFIAIVALITLVTLGGIAAGVVFVGLKATKHPTTPGGPLTASSTVAEDRGTVVFSDDFHDATSGWGADTTASGTTFTYGATGYVIVAKGSLDHFATSPYEKLVQQVAIAVTASQSADSPVDAGYGVSCWRGLNAAEIRYDFLVTTAGDWEVERRDGDLPTDEPIMLKQGSSSVTLGATPVVIEGMCATLADAKTTRLLLFAGTQELADLTDTAPALPDTGWTADLLITSDQSHESIVTATLFEVRDLAA